jgi:hypothetical protein
LVFDTAGMNPLIDAVFDVLPEPEGFEFELHDGHYLLPVFGQDQWRLVMKGKKSGEKVQVIFGGNVIRFLLNALKTVNEEITKAMASR